jgi:hypothetical protein
MAAFDHLLLLLAIRKTYAKSHKYLDIKLLVQIFHDLEPIVIYFDS